ncbi:MAG: Inner membrane transport protein YdhC [Chlamydiia bacterium]|nr:Inner membrane transport protein YdhC [Chlamydiia bacterium]
MDSKFSKNLVFAVTIILACLTQFATEVYAPSLPSMAKMLSTSINFAQWSIAVFMIGVAITQFIYGPLSEVYGRKALLLTGLLIMFIGSIVCMLAVDIEMLIAGRFLQGVGAGSCACLWRSIMRDTFSGKELAKYGSFAVVFIMFIIPAAPVVGGYLQRHYSFRASFVAIAIYTIIGILAVLFGLKETNQHASKSRLKFSYIRDTFLILLTSRVFMGNSLCTFLSYGALIAWITAGPVLLIKHVGITPVYFGWVSFFIALVAFGLGGLLNGVLVPKFGMRFMLRVGWTIMLLSGILLYLGYRIFGVSLWPIAIPSTILLFGSQFIFPNVFAGAFTPFGKIAGYAGALYGFMQVAGGAALGSIISFLPSTTPVPLSIIYVATTALTWILFESIVPKPTSDSTEES